jgi:hypothetical protein
LGGDGRGGEEEDGGEGWEGRSETKSNHVASISARGSHDKRSGRHFKLPVVWVAQGVER